MGKGSNKVLLGNENLGRGASLDHLRSTHSPASAESGESARLHAPATCLQNTASQQSLGGGTAATTGQANLTAARTRNAGGFQGAVGTANQKNQQQLSQNALGIQQAQANLQQQQQAQALTALQSLYGTNLTGSTQAGNAENTAPNEWNSLLNATVSAAGQAASGYLAGQCPAEGSLILMADGSEKPIETLRAGDRIQGIGGDVCVVEDVPSCCGEVILVTAENGLSALNSPSHAYALPKGGFTVAAKSLGQIIVTAEGPSRVISVEKAGKARVFNILTDGCHTYCADGVWALGVGDAERYDTMLMADSLVP